VAIGLSPNLMRHSLSTSVIRSWYASLTAEPLVVK